MRIDAVSYIVERVLAEEPSTRDDDIELYLKVCEICNPLALNMNFEAVLRNRALLGLPNIESVGRTRRKLQETHKEYRGSARATDARFEKFKEVLEYVTSE